MTNLTKEQIIAIFKKNYISISDSMGKENKGMVTTIYRDSIKFFPSYFMAYYFFDSKNLLNNKLNN
jgi:hypothetical protein